MKIQILGVAALSLLLTACSCCDTPPVTEAVVEPAGPGVDTSSVEYFVKSVGDRVFFDFDKYNVGTCGKDTLARQAKWLCEHPEKSVVIAGHCDSRGTREYNYGLGERRAEAVKKELVALGVPASRLSTCSHGKDKPIVCGDTESAHQQNRVAITVLGGGDSGNAAMSPSAAVPPASGGVDVVPGGTSPTGL
ncbi:OmpA family protein [Candidatus Hydrogenosomobacter endosymbioticus]|uniref:Peptidoglycan-associated lipoprotein n=1 Tax=Candidatus Hydrogenosomobacter endosymbioticus TaxID=2558174 RepID=A0ABN6L3T2_9PROT|nr:OmpA family protein [Candidatus Hydrogenosomobacter endosymbioticus]BDB96580.1 peptidoglycan-associated lipoprotein [Candidatus Hydrogenosomobacter endosymbioticus]